MGAIKAMRALLGVILCLVLGMSIWLVSQRQVLEQEEVSLFGLTLRQVKDTSMAPALSPGDLAVTVPREEYGLGDAVLCQDQEGKFFQRLVGSTGDSFIARGDGEGGRGGSAPFPGDHPRSGGGVLAGSRDGI